MCSWRDEVTADQDFIFTVDQFDSEMISDVPEKEIRKNLTRAWNKIVTEPDEILVDLLNETVEKICGYRTDV